MIFYRLLFLLHIYPFCEIFQFPEMKFFKKLSSSNSSSKKLSFLKNRKDKGEKSKIQVDTAPAEEPNDGESWLDLSLPNDFSSSLDMPEFDQKQHSVHSVDNNTISTSSTNTATETHEPFKPCSDEQTIPSTTATTTTTTTVTIVAEEIDDHQSIEDNESLHR
jgi:hypothetical protein